MQYWFQAFPFWQFHVLFNSLFKVLFIFPSRYLFAIGLSPLFSFRWYLPPILDSIPKLSDSLKTHHIGVGSGSKTGFSPSLMPRSNGLKPRLPPKAPLETTIRTLKEWDSKIELFPLHSPLLGESLLVSFPPLIDMLKFSGSSCLIWDHVFRCSPSHIETTPGMSKWVGVNHEKFGRVKGELNLTLSTVGSFLEYDWSFYNQPFRTTTAFQTTPALLIELGNVQIHTQNNSYKSFGMRG